MTLARIKHLQSQLHSLKIDCLIVTDQYNVQYLSDYDELEGDGCLVVSEEQVTLITDARYEEDLKQQLNSAISLRITRDYYGEARNVITELGLKYVGFEDTVSYQTYATLKELFGNSLRPLSGTIQKLREVKDEQEIAILKKSTELAADGFKALLKFVQVDQTEREVSNWLNNWMLVHGATKPSFDTIVASGYRSALPHGSATDKRIADGDMVTVDFGYFYEGYTSDVTRTFAVGDPGEKMREVYAVVKQAQANMFTAIKSGANGQEVDKAGRDYITEKGFGDFYNHGSGHGIGLEIHEGPNLGARYVDEILTSGNIVTAEPGVYLPEIGGVRIEDDLLVTESGNEILTDAPRDLIIL